MARLPRILRKIVLAPVLALGLLGAMAMEQRTHVPPPDVAPYHASVVKAFEDAAAKTWTIGMWSGKDVQIPPAAQRLLRLNANISRDYLDSNPGTIENPRRARVASMLIVQCRDSSDMDGHWPPNCYPARGEKKIAEYRRTITVNGQAIPLIEYQFEGVMQGRSSRHSIYNFLIIPGRGIVRDMADVRAAAADYRTRFLGAAQFQVIMDAYIPQDEREAIFAELIGPFQAVIKAINSGGQQ